VAVAEVTTMTMTTEAVSVVSEPSEASAAHAWDAVAQERLAATCGVAYDALLERMPPLHDGESWVDAATGTGPLAIRAARRGANVNAFDSAPEPLATARSAATAESLNILFDVRTIEHNRYVPEEFLNVGSAFGVMYAFDHRVAASKVAMLCHPMGRIGLISWTRDGWMARAFALVSSFGPAFPTGPEVPFRWGDPAYVDDLFGSFWSFEHQVVDVPLELSDPQEVWRLHLEADGPTHAAAEALDSARRGELERAFVALAGEHRSEDGRAVSRQVLVSVGRRS
jgi:hypothetical protein